MAKIQTKGTTISATNAGSTATGAAMTGTFLLVADQDMYVESGGVAPTAAAPAGNVGSFMLPAKVILTITLNNEFVAARCVTGATGTLWIQPTNG